MKKTIFFMLSFFNLLSFGTYGEYRAYQYYVKSKYNFPHKSEAYLVTSSLAPTTYISYHGGDQAITVDLVRTWVCKGNTGNKQICKSPSNLSFKR